MLPPPSVPPPTRPPSVPPPSVPVSVFVIGAATGALVLLVAVIMCLGVSTSESEPPPEGKSSKDVKATKPARAGGGSRKARKQRTAETTPTSPAADESGVRAAAARGAPKALDGLLGAASRLWQAPVKLERPPGRRVKPAATNTGAGAGSWKLPVERKMAAASPPSKKGRASKVGGSTRKYAPLSCSEV